MIMAIVAPLTCPAHQVTEVGKVRGIGAEMTVSHLDTTHAPHEHVGVQERSMPSHTPSYNEWHDDDTTHEDQYEAELLHCYKGLIHDQGGH